MIGIIYIFFLKLLNDKVMIFLMVFGFIILKLSNVVIVLI